MILEYKISLESSRLKRATLDDTWIPYISEIDSKLYVRQGIISNTSFDSGPSVPEK